MINFIKTVLCDTFTIIPYAFPIIYSYFAIKLFKHEYKELTTTYVFFLLIYLSDWLFVSNKDPDYLLGNIVCLIESYILSVLFIRAYRKKRKNQQNSQNNPDHDITKE